MSTAGLLFEFQFGNVWAHPYDALSAQVDPQGFGLQALAAYQNAQGATLQQSAALQNAYATPRELIQIGPLDC